MVAVIAKAGSSGMEEGVGIAEGGGGGRYREERKVVIAALWRDERIDCVEASRIRC